MSGKMNGAYVMDFKVRVTGQDGKETAVRPYLFPVMDLNGNIKGFNACLERHSLPDMNTRQKIYYRDKCEDIDKRLSALIPDNGGDYFCRPVRSLPTLELLNFALSLLGGE